MSSAPAVAPVVVHGDLTEDALFAAVMDRLAAAAAEAQAAEDAVAEEATSDPSAHCDDPAWWNAQQSGDPGTYVEACGEYPYWLEEFDPGEGEYEPTAEELEGHGVYDEYGYERCGELCGEEPTSGDLQHEFGCEQGDITEGC